VEGRANRFPVAGMSQPSSPVRVNGDGALRIKTVEVLLGSAPFVPIMQTADFGNCNDVADRLYWTRIRRIFIQRQMKTASVIVTDI
jgi:hypothetical protein